MEIYKIESDSQYKNISSCDESIINRFKDFKGQSLKHNWQVPTFQLLENVTNIKSEKNSELEKKLEFDAKCYGNMLFYKSKFDSLFEHLNIELLPVIIGANESNFSFLNVLNVVEAIDFSNLDYRQSMEMLKSNEIKFIKVNIGDFQIFRDRKLINFYYCSESFKNLIKTNNMQGLKFERVGEAI